MKKIVFDTYALIAFFRKEAGYETVRDLLVKVADNEFEAFYVFGERGRNILYDG